jgi:hypothetical protein
MKTYNRTAAAAYANKYAFNYNTDWPSDKGIGGDCTNFVSQALHAGGWTMVQRGTILGSARDSGSWFSGKAGIDIRRDRSRTWAAAANFFQYLTWGGRARGCAVDDLATGDVVQLRSGEGHIYHTTMVTGVLPTGIRNKFIALLTYHTTDTLHKPITALKQEQLVCWKIADVFEEKVPFVMPRAG